MTQHILRDESNCSTVVIGKAASETGYVIVGHNEDDSRSIDQMFSVPRMKHAEGEMVVFGDSPEQKIPQVPETWAYFWTEVRKPGGLSFGDSYFNEWGVAVVTDSARPGRIDEEELKTCTLGYGLRQMLAERAVSARHGVEICKELVEKYGYFSSRIYHIADKDECWSVQICNGHRIAAKRVPDDAVYFVPNWLNLHQIDFADTEHKNYYWSDDIVSFAEERGWYKPAVPGDYSDFDFAATYNDPDESDKQSCIWRDRNGWPVLGFEVKENKAFSCKAPRIYGMADVKNLLRSHWEGRPDANNDHYECNPHQQGTSPKTLCSPCTVESTIAEFGPDAASLCVWRAWAQPCTNIFVPFFIGNLKVPENYAWMNWREARLTHFDPAPVEYRYNPGTAWWQVAALIWLTELDYGFCHEFLAPAIEETEKRWAEEKKQILSVYEQMRACGKFETETAEAFDFRTKELLSVFSLAKAEEGLAWVRTMTGTIGAAKHEANQK